MKSKLLTNHEIEYFVKKAHHPSRAARGIQGRDDFRNFTFWHLESRNLVYNWTLKASSSFEKVWVDFHVTGVAKTMSESLDRKLLISKSKPKYTYER